MQEKSGEVTPGVNSRRTTSDFLWLLVILYALVVTGSYVMPGIIKRVVFVIGSILLPFIFAAIHGSIRYGIKNMAVFIIISLVVSNFFENLSIITGFPFGDYYYTANLGPKILNVPVIIGFAYFSIGYLSWILAQSLIGNIAPSLRKANIFLVPLVAAFIMVCWDFSFDPDSSTINGDWIWLDGGGYFGVPFSNFTGWFLCVFTFFQLFALYISRKPQSTFDKIPEQKKSYWYQASLFYSLYAVDFILKKYFGTVETVTDPAGKSWSTGDIHDTMALVSIFTMIFFTILSVIIIKNNEKISCK
jgi:uncharacterized membrane protein